MNQHSRALIDAECNCDRLETLADRCSAVAARGAEVSLRGLLQDPLLLAGTTHLPAQLGRQSLRGRVQLLGRWGALNRGSTVPDPSYLRMVLRDSPVRRAISRIER